MHIYIEYQAKNYPQTQKILKKFPNAEIIWIKNYKNIFDKQIPFNKSLKPSFVVAKLTWNSILKAPDWYGHNNKTAYFLKTSLNCIFDCDYCYLKWAFKNDIPVYFVNYDDIKNEIRWVIQMNQIRKENIWKDEGMMGKDKMDDLSLSFQNQSLSYKDKIWFYTSDYSDILGMNGISGFLEEFVPFFEQFEDAMMEIRSKSANIKPILDLWFVPKNTEFAFSLNPQELIDKYEKWTSSLKDRIKAINTLLEKWYKVWLRFLPLLPVKNYEKIYTDFVDYIKKTIPMEKIASTFVSGLLYTKDDYKKMLKKMPNLDVLYFLEEEDEYFVRESRKARDFFYDLFSQLDKQCFICLDSKGDLEI